MNIHSSMENVLETRLRYFTEIRGYTPAECYGR